MLLLILAAVLTAQRAEAVSCVTQSMMPAADRSDLTSAVTRIAGYAVSGNKVALRADTLPSIAAQFEGIAATVDGIAPTLKGATLTVENLYLLHAEDLKPGDDEAQFFCSVPGASMLVTLAIPQLPPGTYALAIVHAEGVDKPEQMGLILSHGGGPTQPTKDGLPSANPGPWQLAGFFARPLEIAGHDGVWYWSRARDFGKAQQRWSAWFYYQAAHFLLTPVDFLSSPNLSKLEREASAVRPDGLPGADDTPTMIVTSGDQSFAITNFRIDGELGGLDLVIHYNANAGNVDPVFARTQAIALMQAMLKQHPDLRANFHGLWVFADSSGHQPFAVELPMDQIQ